MKEAKMLITGGSGLVGSYLLQELEGDYTNIFATIHECSTRIGKMIPIDLSQIENLPKLLEEIRPDIIVNLAALTDVDRCEIDKDLAVRMNRDLVTSLSKYLCTNSDAYLVHMSTDYVFDGNAGDYNEDASPHPVNWYGITKLQGEKEIDSRLSKQNWCITRISTPFGMHEKKKNFPLFVIEKLKSGEEIKVLSDQYTSPTYGMNLGKMLKEIIDRRIKGIIHISGASKLSRYEQAVKIAQLFKLNGELIKKVKMEQLTWNALRPKDCSLDIDKARNILSNKPLIFDKALEIFSEEYKRDNRSS